MSAPDRRLESHWRLLHPGNFLGAPDLRGRDVKVTIESVSRDDLNVEGQDEKEPKVVIAFKGKSKRWVANKTNLRHLAAYLRTPLTIDWVGREVWLHPTSKEWRPKTRDWTGKSIRNPQANQVEEAIRVWPIDPPGAKEKQAQAADDHSSDPPPDDAPPAGEEGGQEA